MVALEEAMSKVMHINPLDLHKEVARMYRWDEVAQRTVKVYDTLAFPKRKPGLIRRMFSYLRIGRYFGLLGVLIFSLDCIFLFILNFMCLASNIETSKEIKFKDYAKHIRSNDSNRLYKKMQARSKASKEPVSVGFNKE